MGGKMKKLFDAFFHMRISFQTLRISQNYTYIVFLLSTFQNLALSLYLNPSIWKIFQNLFSPVSSIVTIILFSADGFNNGFFYFQAVVFFYSVCELTIFIYKLITSKKNGKNGYGLSVYHSGIFSETFLFFYVYLFFGLVLQSGFPVYSCFSLPSDQNNNNTILALIDFCGGSSNKSLIVVGTYFLAGFNIIYAAIKLIALTGFILPRNHVSENSIINNSKTLDVSISLIKIFSSFLFFNQIYLSKMFEFVSFIILILSVLHRLYLLKKSISFNFIQSVRDFTHLQFFELFFYISNFLVCFVFPETKEIQIFIFPALILAWFLSFTCENWFFESFFRKKITRLEIRDEELLIYFLVYQYSQQNSANQIIYSRNNDRKETNLINFWIFEHFYDCEESYCLCSSIKKNGFFETNFGKTIIKNTGSSTEDLISMLCRPEFVREFIFHRFKNAIFNKVCCKNARIFFVKFLIFEFQNYFYASSSLKAVNNKNLNIFDDFEIRFLSESFTFQLQIQSNHKTVGNYFPNTEKFFKLINLILKIENNMTNIVEKFAGIIIYLSTIHEKNVSQKKELEHLISNFSEAILLFKSSTKKVPRNLDLLRNLYYFARIFINSTNTTEWLENVIKTSHQMFKNTSIKLFYKAVRKLQNEKIFSKSVKKRDFTGCYEWRTTCSNLLGKSIRS